jgi:serine/threonine protein kinase
MNRGPINLDTRTQGGEAAETIAPETIAPETIAPETIAPETIAPETISPDAGAGKTLPRPELPDHLIAKLRIDIPGYELLDRIDAGGQATVYRARELTSGLTVAIKVLNGGADASPAARDRLLRETAALRALNHPNIVCVIEAGRTEIGLDFIVMNFVDGRPLDALWKDRAFAAKIAPEPPARLRLFKRICDVVQAAHLKGITHRDLSPSNILITDDGEPHILDFGLASTAFDELLSPVGRHATVTGQFIGKVKYASPEQARGERNGIDIRTDVYALGVILYQILTDGAFPYEVVGALVDVLNNIIHSQPLPPSTRLQIKHSKKAESKVRRKQPPLVNETIEAVVLKALEKNPADRYQSAGELAADIDQYFDGRPTAAMPRRGEVVKPRFKLNAKQKVLAILCLTLLMGVLMNLRLILNWVGLSALAVALGATPVPHGGGGGGPRPGAVSAGLPAPRARPRLGTAPKPVFRVDNHDFKLDPKEPGAVAVRSMPPKSYEPATRSQSVNSFYHKQFEDKAPPKDKLKKLYVGPFRREFIWWAWHHWEMRDRAWWAWNNYAYFDHDLWAEWMQDQAFTQLVAQFDASHQTRVLGFVPAQYASNSPEVIYNDEYIDAVYNPVYTTPSIVVDGSAGGRLSNLIEGAQRLFGHKSLAISTLSDRVACYQFVSLPADFDPTYQIEVKRDGDLYIFGPNKTPRSEAFGDEASRWTPVSNLVKGPGIDVVYQRQVKAGEKIHLHGVEWSIASEQIELFSPASPDAQAAWRHVVRDLEQMTNNKGEFVQNNPSLGDYVQEAHDAATQIVTTNNNINDDAVADCHYELNHLQKMAEEDLIQTNDSHLVSAGKDFVRRIKSLVESLNEVDELRDPSLPDQLPVGESGSGAGEQNATGTAAGSGMWTDLLDPKQLGGWTSTDVPNVPLNVGADGTTDVGNHAYTWGKPAEDMIVRATILPRQKAYVDLRKSDKGFYYAMINADGNWAICGYLGTKWLPISGGRLSDKLTLQRYVRQ